MATNREMDSRLEVNAHGSVLMRLMTTLANQQYKVPSSGEYRIKNKVGPPSTY